MEEGRTRWEEGGRGRVGARHKTQAVHDAAMGMAMAQIHAGGCLTVRLPAKIPRSLRAFL